MLDLNEQLHRYMIETAQEVDVADLIAQRERDQVSRDPEMPWRMPNWAIAAAVAAGFIAAIGGASFLLGGSDGSIVPTSPADTASTTVADSPSDASDMLYLEVPPPIRMTSAEQQPWMVDLHTGVESLVAHINALGEAASTADGLGEGWDNRLGDLLELVDSDLERIEAALESVMARNGAIFAGSCSWAFSEASGPQSDAVLAEAERMRSLMCHHQPMAIQELTAQPTREDVVSLWNGPGGPYRYGAEITESFTRLLRAVQAEADLQAASGFELGRVVSFDMAGPYDVATTPEWVWAATADGLHRVDPSDGSIDATIELSSMRAANLEVAEGAVWVAHGTSFTRIDPATATVTGELNLDGWFRTPTRPLTSGHGSLWVLDDQRLLRIDPDTIEVTGTASFGLATGLAYGSESVWVLEGPIVRRLDPDTLETQVSIGLGGDVFHPRFGTPLTYGQDAVWFWSAGLKVIDPAANTVTALIDDPDCCGTTIGFAGDHVIAFGLEEGTLSLIDRATGQASPVGTTRSAAFVIAGGDSGFWAAAPNTGTLYRFDATS